MPHERFDERHIFNLLGFIQLLYDTTCLFTDFWVKPVWGLGCTHNNIHIVYRKSKWKYQSLARRRGSYFWTVISRTKAMSAAFIRPKLTCASGTSCASALVSSTLTPTGGTRTLPASPPRREAPFHPVILRLNLPRQRQSIQR